MKNSLIYLFVVSLILQSCFSYKTVDLNQNPLTLGKIYKIKTEDKFIKAILKAKTDSTLKFIINKNERHIFSTNIKEIKVKKFSDLKTIGFAVGTIGVLTLVALISISTSSDNSDFSDVNLPN